MAQQKGLTLGGIGSPCCCTITPPFSQNVCNCTVTSSTLTLTISNSPSTQRCVCAGNISVTLTYGTNAFSAFPGWFGTYPTTLCLVGAGGTFTVGLIQTGTACTLQFYDSLGTLDCQVALTNSPVVTCSPFSIVWTYAVSGVPGNCYTAGHNCNNVSGGINFTLTP